MRKLIKESQILDEGYEKVVMNILADAGIKVTTFSHGVLYVGASAMDDAKNILDNHPEIFRTPPIDDFDNLYESEKLNEGYFYECKNCGYAWAETGMQVHGREDNPKVDFGVYCPKCGSSRIRAEY